MLRRGKFLAGVAPHLDRYRSPGLGTRTAPTWLPGDSGVFVDHVVASYTLSDKSMLSLTNISTTGAFVALKEHAPELMARVIPPQ